MTEMFGVPNFGSKEAVFMRALAANDGVVDSVKDLNSVAHNTVTSLLCRSFTASLRRAQRDARSLFKSGYVRFSLKKIRSDAPSGI